ncbi:MAG: nucleotide exchange factor GrpE [Evtepia sp.]|uniref:nucleotide exchange factor GrpE n=1 Tax=Evtepia sp. TaxID=2773933 RepID=UPI002A74A001|nr:nucleotide exchange factor GrpE [Evtepia sp.]MDY3013684.1 nucleotide exchange factor GrpE [Evtepia sp.]
MSKKDNDQTIPESTQETPEEAVTQESAEEQAPQPTEEETLKAALREQEDKYLRLLAEYDNYRKRSQKEKENAWSSAKADTAKEFLPVYDNLERALKQETADEAYAKGVEMIMTQLKTVLEKLGIQEIPAQGETFDPNVHNAVMHVDDESLGENVVAEVFQAGFQMGDKVIRHAMVKVAN